MGVVNALASWPLPGLQSQYAALDEMGRQVQLDIEVGVLRLPRLGELGPLMAQDFGLRLELFQLQFTQTAHWQLPTELKHLEELWAEAGALDPLMHAQCRKLKRLGVGQGGLGFFGLNPQSLTQVGVDRVSQPPHQVLNPQSVGRRCTAAAGNL